MTMSKETDKARDARVDKSAQLVQEKEDAKQGIERTAQDKQDHEKHDARDANKPTGVWTGDGHVGPPFTDEPAKNDANERAIQDKEDHDSGRVQPHSGVRSSTLPGHGPVHGAPRGADGSTKAAADNEMARAGHINRVVSGPDALPVDRHDDVSRGPGVAPERIARACHEASRALGQVFSEDPGTPPQAAWIDAPQSHRDSVMEDVKRSLDTRDAPTPDQHTAWLDKKLADGWTKGPAIDLEKKVHPHIAPFAELRPEQRAKILVCQAIVRALR